MVKIIAEIGCNHMGNPEIAHDMIKTAFKCGANYVKFQKRSIKDFLTKEQYEKPYSGPHAFANTYGEHRENLEISIDDWKEILKDFDNVFPTVFDIKSLKDVMQLNPQIIKIGSGQVNNLKLIEEVAKTGVKIILSTGMSTVEEIDSAFELIKDNDPVLMQCTSVYPCPEDQVNLRVIPKLKKRYDCEVGLSGHYVSGSGAIEVAAMMLGATWIERHFTLDRTWKGTDQAASLEPVGLTSVVNSIKSAERALGVGEKRVLEIEVPARMKHRC